VRRPAVWLAALAVALSAAALTVTLTARPGPDPRFPLVCGETFRSAAGQVSAVVYPCQRRVQP
jgi:hypothetical protein